jgi:glycosyltransferase involved in cell wall biosynthesis
MAGNEGDLVRSEAFFAKAVEIQPTNKTALSNYVAVREKSGNPVSFEPADIVFYTEGSPFTGDTLSSRALGGSESALVHISRELAELGKKVRVYNRCTEPGVFDGVVYCPVPEFFSYIREARPQVLISSRFLRPFKAEIGAALKILWIHDHPGSLYISLEDVAAFPIDRFFALSGYQKDRWSKYFGIPTEKFYITRNGVIPPDPMPDLGIRDRFRYIYASRPSRGLDILLELFPEIRKQLPKAELHIFSYIQSGGDPEIEELRKVELPEGAVFRGQVPQHELLCELGRSRLLVYPSTWPETSCITALQSQMMGTPVVTSTSGALPETVPNGTGGVIIPGDPNSTEFGTKFIESVVQLSREDNSWETLSRGGMKLIRQRYLWSTIAREWLDEIERLTP